MVLTDLKKYITWNMAAISGYVCIFVTIIFLLMLLVASSGTTIRADINEIFYEYIMKHLIIPYIKFYRFQFFLIVLLTVLSCVEHTYYEVNDLFGIRLFENHEKAYTFAFALGVSLNFVPLYILFIISIFGITRII